jgi:hypothetical protein
MTGRLLDMSRGLNGKQRVTLELNGDFRAMFDKLKDKDRLDIDIKPHRVKRSKNANAYFHLLCGKIAERMGLGIEEVKTNLVCEYGTFVRDDEGMLTGMKLPAATDPATVYPYTKFYEDRTENGKAIKCYLLFKQTHMMDSAEMARLIDGAVYEAQQLGLETDTPEQLERLRSLWEQAERSTR